jgi:hypothetical protein
MNSTKSFVVPTSREDRALVVDWIQADHPLSVTHNHGVIEHTIIFASGEAVLGR